MDSSINLHTYEITGYRKTSQNFRMVIIVENLLVAVDYAKSKFNLRNCDLVEVEYVPMPKMEEEGIANAK